MITRFWLGRRRSDLTRDAFSRHWDTVHGDLGLALPGLRAYVQNHPIAEPSPVTPPVFDGCSELDFDDVAAMRAAFASPEAVAADRDELAFADPERFGVVVTERHVLDGAGAPDTAARSLTFVRVNPRREREELAAGAERLLREEGPGTGASRVELLVAVDDAPEPQACDVVLSLWFPTREALLESARPWAARVGDALVGLAFGRETALLEPRRKR